MCNPNSSVANRRYRQLAALQSSSGTASLLTQKLLGSMVVDKKATSHHQRTDYTPTIQVRSNNNNKVESLYGGPYDNSSSFFGYDPHHPALQEKHHYNLLYKEPEEQTTTKSSVASKTKRRRKPQKPGLTAKNQERHFVQHHYHDHANEIDDSSESDGDGGANNRRRGGVAVAFPIRLHSVLEQVEVDGFAHVVSWSPHGRCFCIHKPKEFADVVMPRYFRQTKLTSFQRQLNLYGFARLTRGSDSGGYYHELFLRGKEFLCKRMVRTKVKGTKFKAASSPEQEPDFFVLPPVAVVVTPNGSDCDNSENDSNHEAATAAATMSSTTSGTGCHESMFNRQGIFDVSRRGSNSFVVFEEPRVARNTDYQHPYQHNNYQTSFVHDDAKYNKSTPHQETHVHPSFSFGLQSHEMSPLPISSTESYEVSPLPVRSAIGSSTIPSMPDLTSASMSEEEYLDAAVDDLFLQDKQAVNDVLDFVNVWDPSSFNPTDDIELGNLLDKLLED